MLKKITVACIIEKIFYQKSFLFPYVFVKKIYKTKKSFNNNEDKLPYC